MNETFMIKNKKSLKLIDILGGDDTIKIKKKDW